MIHPVTCICFVMALGSGLYLYQSKHDAQVLDRTIEKTVRDTDAVREQTRALRTEWTLLNEPERLRQLAEQYLPTLKPVAPSQFTSLADLDSRLPAPRVIVPEASPVPMAEATPAADPAAVDDAATLAASLPVPPVPPPAPIAVASASMGVPAAAPPPRPSEQRSTEAKVVEQHAAVEPRRAAIVPPRPIVPVALSQPVVAARPPTPEPRPVEPSRVVEQRAAEPSRMADARMSQPPHQYRPAATPVSVPTYAGSSMQGGGSLLGMAHGTAGAPAPLPVPLPRPMPVNSWSGQFPNGG